MLVGSARESYVPGSVGKNKRILLLLLMMDGCGRKEVGEESSLDVRRQTSVGLGLQGWGSGGARATWAPGAAACLQGPLVTVHRQVQLARVTVFKNTLQVTDE